MSRARLSHALFTFGAIAVVAAAVSLVHGSPLPSAEARQAETCPAPSRPLKVWMSAIWAEKLINARQSFTNYAISMSPALVRTAFFLASRDAAGATLPSDVTAVARACGYTGQVKLFVHRARVESELMSFPTSATKWYRDRRYRAIGTGIALDKFGDFHAVYLYGTVSDSDVTYLMYPEYNLEGSPFYGFAEGEVTSPAPRLPGIRVMAWGNIPSCGSCVARGPVYLLKGKRVVARANLDNWGWAVLRAKPGSYTVSMPQIRYGSGNYSYRGVRTLPARGWGQPVLVVIE